MHASYVNVSLEIIMFLFKVWMDYCNRQVILLPPLNLLTHCFLILCNCHNAVRDSEGTKA